MNPIHETSPSRPHLTVKAPPSNTITLDSRVLGRVGTNIQSKQYTLVSCLKLWFLRAKSALEWGAQVSLPGDGNGDNGRGWLKATFDPGSFQVLHMWIWCADTTSACVDVAGPCLTPRPGYGSEEKPCCWSLHCFILLFPFSIFSLFLFWS